MKNEKEITTPQTCYQWRGVLWVPHYNQRDTFVAPGNLARTGQYLRARKAPKVTLSLWPRQKFES